MSDQPVIVCEWCGTERPKPARGRPGRFCSRKCQVAALHRRQAEERRGDRQPCPTCHGIGTVLASPDPGEQP